MLLGPALSFLATWRTLWRHQQVNIFNPLYVDIPDTFSSVPSKMITTSVWCCFPLITKPPTQKAHKTIADNAALSLFYTTHAKAPALILVSVTGISLKFSPWISAHPDVCPRCHVIVDCLLTIPFWETRTPSVHIPPQQGLGITRVAHGRFRVHRVLSPGLWV